MIPALHGNWIDLVILITLAFFVWQGYELGFWIFIIDFLAFLGSFLISLRVYKLLGNFLDSSFSLGHSLSNVLGFIIAAFVIEAILRFFLIKLLEKLPQKIWNNKLNKFLGILPALGEGIILISFILTLILGLPVSPSIKNNISSSKIGGFIVNQTSGFEKALNDAFGGLAQDALNYQTIEPGSNERVSLPKTSGQLSIDMASENEMFKAVNGERAKAGVHPLTWVPKITVVARNYARYMWENNYFGHISPTGQNVGDRLTGAGIMFTLAGENLALAPTEPIAMTGLMNSEGHRENILDSKFNRVGIGVIDNGYYGKIFVQVFTD